MNRLVVIAEGTTEQTFVREQLATHLSWHNVSAWAILSGRQGNRGGVRRWEGARQDILRALRQGVYCTTMIDYYAMPDNWPGRAEASQLDWQSRASFVEERLAEEIANEMGDRFNQEFFIPYVQLHEFESLAFADIERLVSVVHPLSELRRDHLTRTFEAILEAAGHPEAINDGWETCPSRRILGVVPTYRKALHGPIVTSRIGLNVLRERCDHFALWLNRLESIGAE